MSLTDRKITAWDTPVSNEANTPARTAAEMKAIFDANSNQLKAAFNGAMDDLTGTSGAEYIGSAGIGDLSGDTVHEQLADFYSKVFTLGFRQTSLPASGTAINNNTEYRVAAAVGTYAFVWPVNPFEAWIKFTTTASPNITFPEGTKYIGGVPVFSGSTTYEISVKDGVVICMEVVES